MGKIRGTPCMRSHISVHRATARYFSNSFVFQNEIEKELTRDITPALGAGGPRFESGCPDQNYLPYFLQLVKNVLHPKLHCGIPADRRKRSANNSIVETCCMRRIQESGWQECKAVNHLREPSYWRISGRYGENSGDPCTFLVKQSVPQFSICR